MLEKMSELAVVVALFATGLSFERELRPRKWRTVARLLLVAMPLTIAGVALFGVVAMGLSLGAAIVLGAILAPTDPVLAGDIGVGPPGDEEEREPNFSITRADPRRSLRRLGDLEHTRAELRVVRAVREEGEHLGDRAVDHDRGAEVIGHDASTSSLAPHERRIAFGHEIGVRAAAEVPAQARDHELE